MLTSTIHTDPPLLRMTLVPPFGLSEASAAVVRALSTAEISEPLDLLIVATGSQNTPSTEMRRFADDLADLDQRFGRRVAVAADSDLTYGLFRMFGVFAVNAGVDVGVFRSRRDAERWLREMQESPPPSLSS
jgi:hypothetical protein